MDETEELGAGADALPPSASFSFSFSFSSAAAGVGAGPGVADVLAFLAVSSFACASRAKDTSSDFSVTPTKGTPRSVRSALRSFTAIASSVAVPSCTCAGWSSSAAIVVIAATERGISERPRYVLRLSQRVETTLVQHAGQCCNACRDARTPTRAGTHARVAATSGCGAGGRKRGYKSTRGGRGGVGGWGGWVKVFRGSM